MNPLLKTVRQVEFIYSDLEKRTTKFIKSSGLSCFNQCYKCCLNKNIQTSVLEVLPLASKLYKEGKTDKTLDLLSTKPEYCLNLSTLEIEDRQTGCLHYEQRALICRLFGFSGITNKYGQKAVYTCKVIKSEQEQIFQNTTLAINNSLKIPMASHYQMKLNNIDSILSNDVNHINISIEKALLKIAYSESHQPKRSGKINKAS